MFRADRGFTESDRIELEEEHKRARENTIQKLTGYFILIGVIHISKYKFNLSPNS